MRRFVQLLPVYTRGDAIGECVHLVGKAASDLGLAASVAAPVVGAAVGDPLTPVEDLSGLGPSDILVYHLSIGSPLAALAGRTSARRIIYYHNITPPHYFRETNPKTAYWCEKGLSDLAALAPLSDAAIGDSSFNVEELVAAGARSAFRIPLPVDVARLEAPPGSGHPTTLLAVGRIAPNKRLDLLLRTLAALHAQGYPNVDLALVGTEADSGFYASALRSLARALGIGSRLHFTGQHVSDAELARWYARATVYCSLSEHEGFSAPLAEAMARSVPIVAYSAGAIPETVGDAALLLPSNDPLLAAEAISSVLDSKELRAALVTRGHAQFERLSTFDIRGALSDIIGRL